MGAWPGFQLSIFTPNRDLLETSNLNAGPVASPGDRRTSQQKRHPRNTTCPDFRISHFTQMGYIRREIIGTSLEAAQSSGNTHKDSATSLEFQHMEFRINADLFKEYHCDADECLLESGRPFQNYKRESADFRYPEFVAFVHLLRKGQLVCRDCNHIDYENIQEIHQFPTFRIYSAPAFIHQE